MRLSELVELGVLARSELYRDLLHPAGVEYEIAIGMRTGRGEVVVAALGRTEFEFSERDRDVLDVAHPGLEGAMQTAQARERLGRVLAADAIPGTAVVLLDGSGEIVLSSSDAERWLAEHFGPAEHPGGCPRRSPSGSRCRRALPSSANKTAGASPSACCPVTHTHCCSRRRLRPSAPTRWTALAWSRASPRSCALPP